MNLEDLKRSIRSRSTDDLEERIKQIRANRRNRKPKDAEKRIKMEKTKEQKLASAFAGMTDEEKRALFEELTGEKA